MYVIFALIPLGGQGLRLCFVGLLTFAISVSLTTEIHENNTGTFRVTKKQIHKNNIDIFRVTSKQMHKNNIDTFRVTNK